MRTTDHMAVILRGVGSVIDLGGNLRQRTTVTIYTDPSRDCIAMYRDRQNIVDDMRRANQSVSDLVEQCRATKP